MTKIKRWKPKNGVQYFVVGDKSDIVSYLWEGDAMDRIFYAVGNCFHTEDEARLAAKKFKDLMLSLHGEPAAECGKLPKLTAEVFDHPGCPKWAKYAGIAHDGNVIFYEDKTSLGAKADIGLYDTSDWQDILIERPVKLPDWCKVGEWIYIPAIGEYMQIKKVEDDLLFDKEGDHIIYTHCTQARPRHYNEDEMKALVGKPITMPDGSVCLCTAYSKQNKSVIFDNMHWDAQELVNSGCTIDGKPCFVLEHLENGKWVE